MSTTWIVVAAVGAATIALMSVGPVLLGGRPLPTHLTGIVALLAPALLAALVVTQMIGGDEELVLDARLVGLGAAVVAILLRAPLLVVVVAASRCDCRRARFRLTDHWCKPGSALDGAVDSAGSTRRSAPATTASRSGAWRRPAALHRDRHRPSGWRFWRDPAVGDSSDQNFSNRQTQTFAIH